MIKRISVAIVSVLIFAISAIAADIETPVRWRTFVKTAPDGTGTVTFRALIAPGWHLYGLDIPVGGPKATSFDLKGSTGVKFTGPVKAAREPMTIDDAMFGMKLTWWDANVDFTVPFKITDKSQAKIDCKISFMTCDGESCRPPKTESISVPVKQAK